MQCTICPIKSDYNFQYMNENCICDLTKLDSKYLQFFGRGAIFLSNKVLQNIEESIGKIEKEIRKENNSTTGGVLMSYDFHLDGDNPRLIEINTNAGGIFLNYKLLQLAKPCCENTTLQNISDFEDKIVEMFKSEYQNKSNNANTLKTIAIMDENIKEQFLYPELLICKEILEKNNIQTSILNSKDIEVKDGVAYFNNQKIDLIYNRNTDFYFEKLENKKFLELKNENTVVSPSPEDHLVFSDKKNLVDLSRVGSLQNIIPKTILIDKANQEEVWANRKKYFFKPLNGYGGRGSYNGGGLTKKVWEQIINGNYVAQEIVVPNLKLINMEGQKDLFKFDIRAYTYKGEVILLGARVYKGQTTNFRTLGGGFMPIFLTEN